MPARAVLLASVALWALTARAEEPCKPVNPCEVPEGTAPQAQEPPAEFTDEVRQLFALVSCQGPAPAGLDAATVKGFCARNEKLLERARAARAAMDPFPQGQRPEKLPAVVVYPLSGGDLLGALVAYPDARNFTLTTGQLAGDPRLAGLKEPARLRALLDGVLAGGERLLSGGGEPSTGAEKAGALPLLLWSLAADGGEPVGLEYFRVEPGGALHALGAGEIASLEKVSKLAGSPWASCEVLFVRKGAPGRQLVVRLVSADLGDRAAAATPGPLAYLQAKGSFAALLPEANAIAGAGFERLRAVFQQRAAVVASRKR